MSLQLTGLEGKVAVVTGGGAVLQGTFDDLDINAARNPSGPLETTGNLTVNNDVNVGANTITVGGDLTVNGAASQLFMQSAASLVDE